MWFPRVTASLPQFRLGHGPQRAALSNYLYGLLNRPGRHLEAAVSFSPAPLAAAPQATTKLQPATGTSLALASSGSSRPEKVTLDTHPTAPTARNAAAGKDRSVGTPRLHGTNPVASQQTGDSPQQIHRTDIHSRQMSFWFLLFTAALIAAPALHALEPGHGKTIVAAYLVGSRGTPRHAVLLGLIVTGAHTAGVYLLGVITLYASRWILPEQLYPWLGRTSGLTIAGLASYLFLRAWSGEAADHSHEPGQSHSHWFASLVKPRFLQTAGATSNANEAQPLQSSAKGVPLRQLLALGITGGIVPCPAALVVLLSALSLHRVVLGLFLIVAFSLGLAAVLIVIGLLMVYARQSMAHWKSDGQFARRWLPVLSCGTMLFWA